MILEKTREKIYKVYEASQQSLKRTNARMPKWLREIVVYAVMGEIAGAGIGAITSATSGFSDFGLSIEIGALIGVILGTVAGTGKVTGDKIFKMLDAWEGRRYAKNPYPIILKPGPNAKAMTKEEILKRFESD